VLLQNIIGLHYFLDLFKIEQLFKFIFRVYILAIYYKL